MSWGVDHPVFHLQGLNHLYSTRYLMFLQGLYLLVNFPFEFPQGVVHLGYQPHSDHSSNYHSLPCCEILYPRIEYSRARCEQAPSSLLASLGNSS